MTTELHSDVLLVTEEPLSYQFIIEADLALVGGGSALVDY